MTKWLSKWLLTFDPSHVCVHTKNFFFSFLYEKSNMRRPFFNFLKFEKQNPISRHALNTRFIQLQSWKSSICNSQKIILAKGLAIWFFLRLRKSTPHVELPISMYIFPNLSVCPLLNNSKTIGQILTYLASKCGFLHPK